MINETRLHLPARLSNLKSNYILHKIREYVNTDPMQNQKAIWGRTFFGTVLLTTKERQGDGSFVLK